MVIIRMSGGLGNQMFQYALYMKLCSQGKSVKFDDITEYRHDNARPIMLSVFGINYPRATWDEIIALTDGSLKIKDRIKRKIYGRKSLEIKEIDCNYDRALLEYDPAYLTGIFQSEKYFKDIEQQVRAAYTFPERSGMHLPDDLEKYIGTYQYMIENTEAVSIHIRRGDYLLADEVYGDICTKAYYESSIDYMMKKYPKAVFFIFSNDVKWTKNWLEVRYKQENEKEFAEHFYVIEETTEHTGFLDMLLMSKCKHHIIANSSFSWWGAWLNHKDNKTVIVPSVWINNQECKDIYTTGMIKISSDGKFV